MHEYYAVKRGHNPGVYSNWEQAHSQVRGLILGPWFGICMWDVNLRTHGSM